MIALNDVDVQVGAGHRGSQVGALAIALLHLDAQKVLAFCGGGSRVGAGQHEAATVQAIVAARRVQVKMAARPL